MFTLPTQPMTLSDAIKNSFSLWWTTLTSVLPLSIAAALLNGLPILAKSYLGETHLDLYMATFVVVVIINIIPTTAIFAKLGHAAHNQPITLSQSLATSLVKFPPILLWIFISTLVVLSGCGLMYLISSHITALILGVLILVFIFTSLAVYVLCVMPLIIFENLSVIDAIQKSFALTKNHWWYGGVLLTVIVVFAAVINVTGTLLMGSLGSIIAYCFTLPLQTSMIIIFYEQLKLRQMKI